MAISAGAAGAWAAVNATTQTVTLPTHSAGQLLLLWAACKAATPASLDLQVTTPATGWNKVASFADGTLASGTGTGSVTQAIFWKVATSGSETNPVVTWGGSQTAAPGIAVAQSYSKGADEDWVTPVVVQAATNNATSISVTMGSNPGITSGDWGVIAHTTRDDSALTVPTWTATSATLAAVVEYPATAIASGTSNDMAGDSAYRSVTSGTASAAPVVTGTQVAAETGVTGFVRLRVTGNRLVTPTTAALVTAAFAPRIANSAYAAAIQALTPVAYWRLGEPSGTSAFDIAGSNVGTYVGGPTLGAAGALIDGDTAVTLNGTDEWITVPDHASLDQGNGPLSWSVWLKRANTASGFYYFMSKGTQSPSLYMDGATGVVQFFSYAEGAGASSTVSITDTTTWHFIVGTKTSGNAWEIYIDGADVTSVLASSITSSTTDPLLIGNDIINGDEFPGSLDDIALFNAVLTPTEISDLYDVGTSTGTTVTPTTAALALATFAPSVTTPQTITPPTTALTTTTFAPVVAVAVAVIPTTTALNLATFAPTVTAHALATPTTTALTLATFAPAVNLSVIPTMSSLTLTTFAPTAATPQTVTPATPALTLATFAPVLKLSVIPGVTAVTLTTFAPTVTAHALATPTTASLATATFAPTVTAPALQTPTTLALVLTTFAPNVSAFQGQTIVPTTASLTLSQFAPTVTTTLHVTVTPTTAALVTTSFAPTVQAPRLATPTTASLTLAAFAPSVSTVQVFTPTTASLVTATFAPSATISDNVAVIPGTVALVLTQFDPVVTGVAPFLATPTTAALVLTVYPPEAFGGGPIDFIDGELVLTVPARGRLVVTTPRIDAEIDAA